MKTPITLTIDIEKKCLFESMKEVHGMSISGLLDSALDALFNEISPLSLLEIKIKQHEEQIEELEQMRLKASIAEDQLKIYRQTNKPSQKDEMKDDKVDQFLETMRMQKFNEYRDSTIKMWKKGDMNWPRIVESYQFKNITEAKEWFVKNIAETEA